MLSEWRKYKKAYLCVFFLGHFNILVVKDVCKWLWKLKRTAIISAICWGFVVEPNQTWSAIDLIPHCSGWASVHTCLGSQEHPLSCTLQGSIPACGIKPIWGWASNIHILTKVLGYFSIEMKEPLIQLYGRQILSTLHFLRLILELYIHMKSIR